ncbi:LytTR family transcriptional regulator [Pelagibius litoralis]|uniref:LytTR family transcriptional regulator n=1 Tax=Pelagibius litoralis TaxID=374515 RepID=A0A967EXG1_9PROT|nr:LytTR family DNA-binding domain-containing protein [Pelagibius litoralis]NIA69197.1 LytTR family transcriptional regulator [Pelagibius litoralis]
MTLLAGLLLGSHQRAAFAEFSLLFGYGYWVVRLLMAYVFFAGCLLLLELSPLGNRLAWWWLALPAALITLPLFTLAVTMVDLILGLPEMGLNALSGTDPGGMVGRFALESLYHLDNQLILAALIVLPRLLIEQPWAVMPDKSQEDRDEDGAPAQGAPAARETEAVPAPAFLRRLDQSLGGEILAIQAQEHYVRIVTTEGSACTLYRFGDAVQELRALPGLQVHRSFWVAERGVTALRQGGRSLRIVLRNGEEVPVSAKHAELVQDRFSSRLKPVA